MKAYLMTKITNTKTQEWQLKYFIEVSADKPLDNAKAQYLLAF